MGNPVSILVVDDEENVRHVLATYLKKNGYDCSTANSAEEAMDMIKGKFFNLVITDIVMPGASGFDLTRFVKNSAPKTAVICITGMTDTKFASEAVKLGVVSTLIKPFKLSQVMTSIERAIKFQSIASGRLPEPPVQPGSQLN